MHDNFMVPKIVQVLLKKLPNIERNRNCEKILLWGSTRVLNVYVKFMYDLALRYFKKSL